MASPRLDSDPVALSGLTSLSVSLSRFLFGVSSVCQTDSPQGCRAAGTSPDLAVCQLQAHGRSPASVLDVHR